MHAVTPVREAFEQVTQAFRHIDRYRESLEKVTVQGASELYGGSGVSYRDLEKADQCLERALDLDGDYLNAIYYAGVVKDLIGCSADAVIFFERVVEQIDPEESGADSLRDEARFNLGLAHYHQYSHPHLAKASHLLGELIQQRSLDPTLKGLAHAVLAQTHAMWIIPSSQQRETLGRGDIQTYVEERFHQAEATQEALEKSLQTEEFSNLPGAARQRIEATLRNAMGMALMYSTDYLEDPEQVRQRLAKSQDCLQAVQRTMPKDWANTCDLGSVSLRLGYHARDRAQRAKSFDEASRLLARVVQELRPQYGFALYELGRLHRVQSQWSVAMNFLQSSRAIETRYRDVGDGTVDAEIRRVEARSTDFPI